MALRLIRHAIFLVLGNLGNALRVSVGPMIIGFVLILLLSSTSAITPGLASAIGENPMQASDLIEEQLGSLILVLLAVAVIAIIVFSWIAVAWHRFILLEEYPGLLPAISQRRLGAYIWKTLVLILVLIVILVPLSVVAGFVLVIFDGQALAGGPSLSQALVSIALSAVVSWVWLRFAVSLPAAAVGKPLSLGAAWTGTADASGAIFGAGLLLSGFNIAINALGGALVDDSATAALILAIVIQWVTLMIGASMLTTLYGITIEKRQLP